MASEREVEDKDTGITDGLVRKRKEHSGKRRQKTQPIGKYDPELPPGPPHPVFLFLSHQYPLEPPHSKYPEYFSHNQANSDSQWKHLCLSSIIEAFSCPRLFPHHTLPFLCPSKQNIANRNTKTQSNLPTPVGTKLGQSPEAWSLDCSPEEKHCPPPSFKDLPSYIIASIFSPWVLLPFCPSIIFTLE